MKIPIWITEIPASISKWISHFDQSPDFIVAMAHMWFACSVLLILSHLGLSLWFGLPVCIVIASWKEFIYDLKQEHNPPQTFMDSTTDFVEYMAGLTVATLIILL